MLLGKKEDSALIYESRCAVANKEEIGLVVTDENTDQVILQEQTAGN